MTAALRPTLEIVIHHRQPPVWPDAHAVVA